MTSSTAEMPSAREITLIVAATSKMGIGLNGTLPWTGLKKEMAYFARVTKRVSNPSSKNVVIMGRKTWESIPPKFRPLKDRINVNISRSNSDFQIRPAEQGKEAHYDAESLGATMAYLTTNTSDKPSIEKIFVIGGGQIYKAALERKEAKRILFTRILDDFECDTSFPVTLGEDGKGADGWVRRSKEELDAWVGENVPDGEQVEGEKGTRYVFEMWEKENE